MSDALSPEAFVNACTRPGAFQRVTWESVGKPAGPHKGRDLRKRVAATIRTGIQYANMAVNRDRETGALPWGEWFIYPYVIVHKGNYYARLYVADGSVRTSYTVDGEAVDRDTYNGFLPASASKPRKSNGGTITVKLESLTLTPVAAAAAA